MVAAPPWGVARRTRACLRKAMRFLPSTAWARRGWPRRGPRRRATHGASVSSRWPLAPPPAKALGAGFAALSGAHAAERYGSRGHSCCRRGRKRRDAPVGAARTEWPRRRGARSKLVDAPPKTHPSMRHIEEAVDGAFMTLIWGYQQTGTGARRAPPPQGSGSSACASTTIARPSRRRVAAPEEEPRMRSSTSCTRSRPAPERPCGSPSTPRC